MHHVDDVAHIFAQVHYTIDEPIKIVFLGLSELSSRVVFVVGDKDGCKLIQLVSD